VESVQGDERDVIVFSIGYARDADGRFQQRFGWLNMPGGENRLNVAITRARKRIFVIQSFDPGDLSTEGSAGNGPRFLKEYLRYAVAVSDGDDALTSEILGSLRPDATDADIPSDGFMDDLAAALEKEGYGVERGLRTGDYTMDMALTYDGRYIAGIEDDRRVFASGGTSRERDYHRRMFMNGKGWNIIRTWTPSVQRDPAGEIARIVNVANRIRDSFR